MPATAGRVRMPANNRVHSSAALQTHGIWQSAIGYDPYAPTKDDSKTSSRQKSSAAAAAAAEPEGENAYQSFQELLALARITGSNADEARGACKRCGRVGHLSFQCRNFLSVKDDNKDIDPEADEAAVLSGLDKINGKGTKVVESKESEEETDENETSDSEVDSEMERIIAERYGKKTNRRKEASDEEGSDSDSHHGKKRGRSKKRRSKRRGSDESEDEDERRRRRRDKRRKRDESSSPSCSSSYGVSVPPRPLRYYCWSVCRNGIWDGEDSWQPGLEECHAWGCIDRGSDICCQQQEQRQDHDGRYHRKCYCNCGNISQLSHLSNGS